MTRLGYLHRGTPIVEPKHETRRTRIRQFIVVILKHFVGITWHCSTTLRHKKVSSLVAILTP